MFGYMTFNMKYYILSQIFYKKNRVCNSAQSISKFLQKEIPRCENASFEIDFP